MTRRALGLGALVVLYAGIVGWLTWPLAARVATHLADTRWVCRCDPYLMAWALAHQSRALVTDPAALPHGNIYHPTPYALFYGDAGFGALPLFAPAFLLTGNPTLALNVTFLGGIALTAAALHLVTRHWTGSHLAGFIAAWTFLTARWVLWRWLPVMQTYAVLFYFPFIILLASVPASRFRSMLPLVALIALQALTSAYVAVAVVIPLALLALGRFLRRTTRGAGLRLAAGLALAVVLVLPAYAGYAMLRLGNAVDPTQSIWHRPMNQTALPWGLLSHDAPTGVAFAVFGLVAAGALAAAWRARREGAWPRRAAWQHGGFWVVVGTTISLSPIARWDGEPVRLPHALVAEWTPFYEAIREPDRLAVGALMGLALLGGIAFAECARVLDRGRRSALGSTMITLLAVLIAGVMYVQYAYALALPPRVGWRPLPRTYPILAPPTESALLSVIRARAGPVLELPIGRREVYRPFEAPLHALAMYRSIFHGQPVLNGYNGYFPKSFPERMGLARRLPEASALAALKRETGLRLVLVHPRHFGAVDRAICKLRRRQNLTSSLCAGNLAAAERAVWMELASSGGREDLRLVASDDESLLFEVQDPKVQASGPR